MMMMRRWNASTVCLTSRVDKVRRQQESKDDGNFQGKPKRPTFERESRKGAGGIATTTPIRAIARPSICGGDGRVRRRATAPVQASGPHLNTDQFHQGGKGGQGKQRKWGHRRKGGHRGGDAQVFRAERRVDNECSKPHELFETESCPSPVKEDNKRNDLPP